jgi:hypothetical protein
MSFERYNSEDEMRHGVSIRMQRELFLAEPPTLRKQTRERVRRTLQTEKARRRSRPSYLAQHALEIYDIDPRSL